GRYEGGNEGVGREQALDGGQAGHGLAFGDGVGRRLHQVRQGRAQVAQAVGQGGVAQLAGGGGGVGNGIGAGDDDAHGQLHGLRLRRGGGAERGGDRRLERAVQRRRSVGGERERDRLRLARLERHRGQAADRQARGGRRRQRHVL